MGKTVALVLRGPCTVACYSTITIVDCSDSKKKKKKEKNSETKKTGFLLRNGPQLRASKNQKGNHCVCYDEEKCGCQDNSTLARCQISCEMLYACYLFYASQLLWLGNIATPV